jgi:hypothetical protein
MVEELVMQTCRCPDCPHDTVSKTEKILIGSLTGLLVMSPQVALVGKNIFATSLQPAALAVGLASMLPMLLVLLLSLCLLVRMASSGPLETVLTATGLPAVISTLLQLGEFAAK